MAERIILELRPNTHSLGKTGQPEAIDICDGGSVWASVHIDTFWRSRDTRDDSAIYSRLRRGEMVTVAITAVEPDAPR